MFLSPEAVTKSAWLYIATIGACISALPPQPAPPKEFREKYNDPSPTSGGKNSSSAVSPQIDYKAARTSFGLNYYPYLFAVWTMAMGTLEAFHTLDLFPQIMPVGHTTTARTFNVQLIAGILLTIASAGLRIAAFHSLGKLFTYHLSIFPEHKLVTNGVYAYCRHPSYTATPFIHWGVLLVITAPGSVLYDYLGVDWMKILITVLGLLVVSVSYVYVGRAELEDQVLRREFGKEWEEWARKVPYKFIPYLI